MTIKNIAFGLSLLLLNMTLINCGGGDSESASNTVDDPNVDVVPLEPTELEGTWLSYDCIAEEDIYHQPTGRYLRNGSIYSLNEVHNVRYFYTESTCSDFSSSRNITDPITFVIGEIVNVMTHAREINYTLENGDIHYTLYDITEHSSVTIELSGGLLTSALDGVSEARRPTEMDYTAPHRLEL